jgi:hypothetical protein
MTASAPSWLAATRSCAAWEVPQSSRIRPLSIPRRETPHTDPSVRGPSRLDGMTLYHRRKAAAAH